MIRRLAVASLLLAVSATAAAASPEPARGRGPDANKDGYVSRAENIAAGEKGFTRIDQNRSGFLEADELARLAKYTGGKNTLAPADFDKDGRISKAEFAKASAYRFDQADANKDGRLDAAEQAALRKSRGF